MNRRICFGTCAGVLLSAMLFAADPPATATGSQPAPRDASLVQNGKNAVRYAVWQGDKQVVADKDGVVHLKREAFEFRFTGDVSSAALLASHSPDVSKSLNMAKAPVITLIGMGGAHDDDELLVEDAPEHAPKLWPWDEFAKNFGADEAAGYTKQLHKAYESLPLVLEASSQYIDSTPEDTQCTCVVKTLFKSDFKTDKGLYIVVMITDKVDGGTFLSLKWTSFRILFDG